jgi:hypothetical protein
MIRIALLSILVVSGCTGGSRDGNQSDTNPGKGENKISVTDSLPDEPLFSFSLDGKQYNLAPLSVQASYLGSDSSITISAWANDSMALSITMPHAKKNSAFMVPTGYSSARTKIAGSDEWAVVSTLTLSGYPLKDVSFNNLNDGFHENKVTPDAITVTSFRQAEGRSYLLKGYIHTRLLKNVYEGSTNSYNHDYDLEGKFVIRFDVWE